MQRFSACGCLVHSFSFRASNGCGGVELAFKLLVWSCPGKILIFHASIMWCWDVILFETVCYLFLPSRGSTESPRSLLTDANAGRTTEISLQTPPLHQGVELSQGWRPRAPGTPPKGVLPPERRLFPCLPYSLLTLQGLKGWVGTLVPQGYPNKSP